MSEKPMKSRHGFTLVELMIVVAIIAILTAITLPLYQEQVRKGARQQAKGTLMQIAQLQERYYSSNSTYQAAFPLLLGLGNAAPVYSGGRDFADPAGKHLITMAAGTGTPGCANIGCGFVLTAALNGTYLDPKCTTLTLSSTGARGFTGSGTARDCW